MVKIPNRDTSGVFRTRSNIYDGDFLRKQWTANENISNVVENIDIFIYCIQKYKWDKQPVTFNM